MTSRRTGRTLCRTAVDLAQLAGAAGALVHPPRVPVRVVRPSVRARWTRSCCLACWRQVARDRLRRGAGAGGARVGREALTCGVEFLAEEALALWCQLVRRMRSRAGGAAVAAHGHLQPRWAGQHWAGGFGAGESACLAGALSAGVGGVSLGLALLQGDTLPPAGAAGGTALTRQGRRGCVTGNITSCLTLGDHPVPALCLLTHVDTSHRSKLAVLHHCRRVERTVSALTTTLPLNLRLQVVAAANTWAQLGLISAGLRSSTAVARYARVGVRDAHHLNPLPLPCGALHVLSVQALAGGQPCHQQHHHQPTRHAGSREGEGQQLQPGVHAHRLLYLRLS